MESRLRLADSGVGGKGVIHHPASRKAPDMTPISTYSRLDM